MKWGIDSLAVDTRCVLGTKSQVPVFGLSIGSGTIFFGRQTYQELSPNSIARLDKLKGMEGVVAMQSQ